MKKEKNPFELMEKLILIYGKDSIEHIIEFYLKEALDFSLKYLKNADELTQEQFDRISNNIFNDYKNYLIISTEKTLKKIKKDKK